MKNFYCIFTLIFMAACVASCSEDDPETIDQPLEPAIPVNPDPEPEPIPEPDSLEAKAPKYRVQQLSINTNGIEITSKEEYVPCTITLTADTAEWCYEGTAGVRGRGNSSWLWYDKKPYRIKLDKKSEILGLSSGKSWVLLANYRDPTDLMNTFVFELGELLDMPYTNHTRYVEVILNGEYNGLYQLTEQVQQGKCRVNIDENGGFLISLDRDDGPELAPQESDNFWSQIYHMPVCVKNPDKPSAEIIARVSDVLALLEKAIYNGRYDEVKTLLDIRSFIDFLIIQELVYNVELDAPRSMYMHKDIDGDIWHMGPLWDFDGGYDFDWSDMYTGHRFFVNYQELVLGTDPASHRGTIYNVPGFFSDLFMVPEFVSDYKNRWKKVKALVGIAWENTLKYVDDEAWTREQQTWPIGLTYGLQIERMQSWLNNRIVYLDNVVTQY